MRLLDGETTPLRHPLGHEDHGRIVVLWRRPMRAVTLAGVVGAVLSLVPLFIAPDPGPLRLACFALLAIASVSLAFLGWTRPVRVEISKGTFGLDWGGEPLPLPACVSLDGDPTEDPPLYQAVVCWDDGRRRVVLERDEPGPVLADALEIGKRLGLDVQPGWGLERHFSATSLAVGWASAAASEPSIAKSPSHVDVALWHAQRRVAGTTFVAGIFVLVSTAVLIRSPERSIGPSTLELALPVLAACFAIVLGAILFGVRRRIELSPAGIDATTLLYGFPIGSRTRLASGVARAFAVSPDGGPARHVLFATTSGPASIAAHSEGAGWLVARMLQPAPSKPAPAARPLATSARYRGPDRPARLRS
jgi:hypothetical protein